MKILLVLAAIVLAAALVVSATMGAETLVPGGDSAKKQPRGSMTVYTGKARVLPAGLSPPAVKGSGFKPGENVTVRLVDGAAKATRRVKADSKGAFLVRLQNDYDRCNGMTVIAVGDKGSKATFQLSELLCPSG
jgi:hypothetical protein